MAAKPFKIRVKPTESLSLKQTAKKYRLSKSEFAEVRHATAWLTIWGDKKLQPRAIGKTGRVIAFKSSKKK